jgi:ubiquinone/menaquinone biosynthesis C-methylase UbiE
VTSLPELYPSTLEYVRSRSIAHDYDGFNARNELFDFDTRFLDNFISGSGKLIDIGCGTGRHVVHFARRGFDVTGLDLSQDMLSIASEKVSASGLKATFVRRDMRDLSDFPDGKYDYATCMFSTLGMVPGRDARQKVANHIYRMLAPGGRFFLHGHNRLHRWYSPDRLGWLIMNMVFSALGRDELGDLHMDSYRGIPDMYLHIFTEGEMRNLLVKARFEDVYIVRLNERRNGELSGTWLRSTRANGFIAVGTKKKRY